MTWPLVKQSLTQDKHVTRWFSKRGQHKVAMMYTALCKAAIHPKFFTIGKDDDHLIMIKLKTCSAHLPTKFRDT